MQRDCIAIHQTKSINYLLTKLIRKQFRCLKTECCVPKNAELPQRAEHIRKWDFTPIISGNAALKHEVLAQTDGEMNMFFIFCSLFHGITKKAQF